MGCASGAVALFDAATGSASQFGTRHAAPVTRVAWAAAPGAEGRFHSLSGDGVLLQWEVRTSHPCL